MSEQPQEPWTPENHHPSCSPHDRDLVWHCNQCGANESAESWHNAALTAEREKRELIESINRSLAEALDTANRKGEDLTVSGMAAVGSLMETQKLLVDALEQIADDTVCTPIIGAKSDREIARDALAKVKEGK
jgi:hypothetical protein